MSVTTTFSFSYVILLPNKIPIKMDIITIIKTSESLNVCLLVNFSFIFFLDMLSPDFLCLSYHIYTLMDIIYFIKFQ